MKLGMVVKVCNHRIWEVKEESYESVNQSQPGIYIGRDHI